MIKVTDGMLVLYKRQYSDTQGAEIWLAPEAIDGIEPHRDGCLVYASGHMWDVAHSHTEIAQIVRTARGRR